MPTIYTFIYTIYNYITCTVSLKVLKVLKCWSSNMIQVIKDFLIVDKYFRYRTSATVETLVKHQLKGLTMYM